MDGLIVILFLVLVVIVISLYETRDSSDYGPGPNISMNEVLYPADIKCDKCEEIIPVTPFTIEGDTWDLKCPNCKEIGYKHPKSEERKQQIKDMLDW